MYGRRGNTVWLKPAWVILSIQLSVRGWELFFYTRSCAGGNGWWWYWLSSGGLHHLKLSPTSVDLAGLGIFICTRWADQEAGSARISTWAGPRNDDDLHPGLRYPGGGTGERQRCIWSYHPFDQYNAGSYRYCYSHSFIVILGWSQKCAPLHDRYPSVHCSNYPVPAWDLPLS